MTRKPSRSHRSRNSGAGGLCAVRIGVGAHRLQRSRAGGARPRSGTAAPSRAAVVMQVHAPHLHPAAVEQEPAILVVGDACGCRTSSRPSSTRATAGDDRRWSVYSAGDSSDQSRGDSTRSRCSSSTASRRRPARTASPCGRPPARRSPPPPSGARRSATRRSRRSRPGCGHHVGAGAVGARGRHVGAPVADVQPVGDGQPDVAVDPAAGSTSGSWAGASCPLARPPR